MAIGLVSTLLLQSVGTAVGSMTAFVTEVVSRPLGPSNNFLQKFWGYRGGVYEGRSLIGGVGAVGTVGGSGAVDRDHHL